MDLVVKPDAVNAAITVDGIRSKADSATPEITTAMIDFLKGLAALDVKEKRKRQSGSFFVIKEEAVIPVSISIAGSSAGQQLRIDFDRAHTMTRTIPQVGFLPPQEKTVQSIMDPMTRGGVVLLAAAPGQGLTSTALAMLSGHDAFTAAVKTLEKISFIDSMASIIKYGLPRKAELIIQRICNPSFVAVPMWCMWRMRPKLAWAN